MSRRVTWLEWHNQRLAHIPFNKSPDICRRIALTSSR